MRAKASGARKLAVFKPGDLVFYWRKQFGNHGVETKGQNFKKGGFIGPARVLATETKVESDGQRRPTQHVWLFRGSKLLKATPNLLRHAREREDIQYPGLYLVCWNREKPRPMRTWPVINPNSS